MIPNPNDEAAATALVHDLARHAGDEEALQRVLQGAADTRDAAALAELALHALLVTFADCMTRSPQDPTDLVPVNVPADEGETA